MGGGDGRQCITLQSNYINLSTIFCPTSHLRTSDKRTNNNLLLGSWLANQNIFLFVAGGVFFGYYFEWFDRQKFLREMNLTVLGGFVFFLYEILFFVIFFLMHILICI